MQRLSKEEKEEFLKFANSIKYDMQILKTIEHDFLSDAEGKPDLDRLNSFLTQYNAFINHQPKSFKPMKDSKILM
jgi:hypothetical protein